MGVLYNPAITLTQFVVVLLIWSLLILVTRYVKTHVHWVGKLIDGEPVTIIKNGRILVDNCLKVNLSAKEVDFKLRTAGGVYNISEVKRAIIEQNGSLTVLRQGGDGSIRYPVIVDGQIDNDVLEIMGKDEKWLTQVLAQHGGVTNVKDVFMATFKNNELQVVRYTEND